MTKLLIFFVSQTISVKKQPNLSYKGNISSKDKTVVRCCHSCLLKSPQGFSFR